MAVIRYYLNYNNDEDLARGLLILFMPHRDEMMEIHTQDVRKILSLHEEVVERKRNLFEKYKAKRLIVLILAKISLRFWRASCNAGYKKPVSEL